MSSANKEKEEKLIIEEPIYIGDHHNDHNNDTHSEDVPYNDPQDMQGKLRQLDENLIHVLEEKQQLLVQLIDNNTPDIPDKVQSKLDEDTGCPQYLIEACQYHTSNIVDMMKESSALGNLTLQSEPEELVPSVEDMSIPTQMKEFLEIANRMNTIFTNHLAKSTSTSSTVPMPQVQETSKASKKTAINRRDKETERRNLELALDEVKRLRRLHKATTAWRQT